MTKEQQKVRIAVDAGLNYHSTSSNVSVTVSGKGIFVHLYCTIIYAKVRGREYFSDGGWNTRTTLGYIHILGGVAYSTNKKRNALKLRTQTEMSNLYWHGTLKSK